MDAEARHSIRLYQSEIEAMDRQVQMLVDDVTKARIAADAADRAYKHSVNILHQHMLGRAELIRLIADYAKEDAA